MSPNKGSFQRERINSLPSTFVMADCCWFSGDVWFWKPKPKPTDSFDRDSRSQALKVIEVHLHGKEASCFSGSFKASKLVLELLESEKCSIIIIINLPFSPLKLEENTAKEWSVQSLKAVTMEALRSGFNMMFFLLPWVKRAPIVGEMKPIWLKCGKCVVKSPPTRVV